MMKDKIARIITTALIFLTLFLPLFSFRALAAPADVINVLDVKVFSNYSVSGDWLMTIAANVTQSPYSPNQIPSHYFSIRLMDSTNTSLILASVPLQAWGYRPSSIYFSTTLANSLQWSTNYTIQIHEDVSPFSTANYTIQPADWIGGSLDVLDQWVLQLATSIGLNDVNSSTYYTSSSPTLGTVLNAAGSTIFIRGIPALANIRPDIFELASQRTGHTDASHPHTTENSVDYHTMWGPIISGVFDDLGAMAGVSGATVGGFLLFIPFLALTATGALIGHLPTGLATGYLFIALGAYTRVIDWRLFGLVTFISAAIWIYKVWLSK